MKLRTLILPALAALGASAHAADFFGDFSTTTNDYSNGWEYGTTATAGDMDGAITPFASYKPGTDDNGVGRWSNPTEVSLVPAAFYSPVGGGTSHFVTPGTAALHGGINGEIAVASYMVPTTGFYSIAATFGTGDSGAVDDSVSVGGLVLGSSPNEGGAYSFGTVAPLLITAGTLIDFSVGTAGNYGSDTTPLTATITPQAVPEPSAIAALGLGALGLLRRRRK